MQKLSAYFPTQSLIYLLICCAGVIVFVIMIILPARKATAELDTEITNLEARIEERLHGGGLEAFLPLYGPTATIVEHLPVDAAIPTPRDRRKDADHAVRAQHALRLQSPVERIRPVVILCTARYVLNVARRSQPAA